MSDKIKASQPKRSEYFLLKTREDHRAPNTRSKDDDDYNLTDVDWKRKRWIDFYADFHEFDVELVSFRTRKTVSKIRKLFPSREALALRRHEFNNLLAFDCVREYL